jgi:glycosyltransferase involved in cell wall biosynthesis
MNTKLTVILPVYNAMPFLPAAVESILRQSFPDFVFVIVNDGSFDGSEQYLTSLRDPRVEIINQANAGQGAARNLALNRCRTEYVALMDADDISMPDRFLAQLGYLESHPDVVMLGTQFEFLIGTVVQQAPRTPLDHEAIVARLMKGRAGLCHPSIMFRTATANACGGYPVGVFGEDFDFCLRMCERGHAANLDQVLFRYRLQGGQTSMTKTKQVIHVNHYSAHIATCRRKGTPTPTLDEFLQSASLVSRASWMLEAWELIQYRTARIQMGSGEPLRGALRMAFLGMCHPISAIRHVGHAVRMLLKAPSL